MKDQPEILSKSQAIAQVAARLTGPTPLDDVIQDVQARWHSTAKNPRAGILQTIKSEFLGTALLFLDGDTLVPLQAAMAGVRFRHLLARQEIKRGWLFQLPAFWNMAPWDLPPAAFQFEDASGQPIPAGAEALSRRVDTFFGAETIEIYAFDLHNWFQKLRLRRGDSLLITVMDWSAGRFRLEPEPARTRERHASEIQAHNQAMADCLYEMLETARYEEADGRVAVPTAYLRQKELARYPADHWLELVDRDPRMHWSGYGIVYADQKSPLEAIFSNLSGASKQEAKPDRRPLSKQQSDQVYRFKAALTHRKSLWREIEIQGVQTLFKFDRILRTAFQLDQSDHLSGFWRLIQRKGNSRLREVAIGDLDPFGGGDAASIRVASLSLEPGDRLKYVYDFGDWIEFRLELNAITEPEAATGYPRITAQNRPRYQYCRTCEAGDRKSVAFWVCTTCSNRLNSGYYLCEACISQHDGDHHITKILY
jgi:hypothetical protein